MRKLVGYRSKLREVNERKGNYNNSQIERGSGVTRMTVIQWMKGEALMVKLDIDILSKFAMFFKVEPQELIEAVYEGEEVSARSAPATVPA